ncbi:MAG: ABC transporter ATP-binding protein [Lentimicrobium sp.]|jgi:ABC-2 type transport system ATP-binding protein|nr:ABC transporter ATP-binding protein [Lentimicrobium sp.]MDD2527074.1 ABC transporter ATP-binding protein [Lentimicrobiaceae bacterium]MDD4598490.1 ABC transporter ATP-binding protein [Lentimicrobiaceae bacterium]MDY0026284.1 ABC transporter ATP-binding protein [Lentimicrobium sp.]HAH57536.1 ABC transporter ATP-binding protein [Bacteroidales bacterium]
MTEPLDNILIRIRELTKTFKQQTVINGLTVDLNSNDRIALIGQNGAGKTTLIRCILGQYNFEGELEVMGMNPRKSRKLILQEIGFVPQTPPPIKLTVKELINFLEKITHTPAAEFYKISNDLGLDIAQNLSKPFHKLSGGMKQKLLISFALGRKVKVLLLDEPSANLDPQARIILFDHLKNYSTNTLMVLSSHRMEEIGDLVTRVIEMDLGQIVVDKEVNNPQNILSHEKSF